MPPSCPTLCQDFPAPTELALSSGAGLALHRQTPHLDEHIFIFTSRNTHLKSPSLTWTPRPLLLPAALPAVEGAFPLPVCARPSEGIWVPLSITQKHFCFYCEKSTARAAEQLSCPNSRKAGAAPTRRETAPTHLCALFSLFPAFPRPGSRGMCLDGRRYVWCCGAESPLSELLACRSPAKPPALWRGGGQAEREGSCLFWRDEGKVSYSCHQEDPAHAREGRVGTMGWLSSCMVEQLSLVWQ